MTDLSSHPPARGLSAESWNIPRAVGRVARFVARRTGTLAESAATARRARRTRTALAALSDAQRRDIGLSGRSIDAGEAGLGDINRARGYSWPSELGAPLGR